jgi:hypothetical protein
MLTQATPLASLVSQLTSTVVSILAVSFSGEVMVKGFLKGAACLVSDFDLYSPDGKFVRSFSLEPLFQENEYGAKPPWIPRKITCSESAQSKLQEISALTVIASAAVMVKVLEMVHPLASVTVIRIPLYSQVSDFFRGFSI